MLMTNITDCELLVFHVILNADQEITLVEIMSALEEKYHNGWERSTVCTFVGHLVQKGYVQSRRQGRKFYYSPIVDKDYFKAEQLTNFSKIFFDGDLDRMICAAFKAKGASPKAVKEVENILKNLSMIR